MSKTAVHDHLITRARPKEEGKSQINQSLYSMSNSDANPNMSRRQGCGDSRPGCSSRNGPRSNPSIVRHSIPVPLGSRPKLTGPSDGADKLETGQATVKHHTIQDVIGSLSSSNELKVYNALVHLRTKCSKEVASVQKLYDCGGIHSLLKLLSKTISEGILFVPDHACETDCETSSDTSAVQSAMIGASKAEEAIRQIDTSKYPILVSATANEQRCPICVQKQLTEGRSIAEGLPDEDCGHQLVEKVEFSSQQKRLLDLCLSILGNCLLLDERTRNLAVKLDAIRLLAKLFISCDVESIQNRAGRTLANIALDKRIIRQIVKEENLISTVVQVLAESENNDCQQSYIRLLRLIGATDDGRDAVIKAEGLRPIAEKLKSDSQPLVTAAFRAVQDLTIRLNNGCVRQMIEADCTSFLVECITSSKDTFALAILLNLAPHDDFRPVFGAAGGIKCFIGLAESGSKSPHVTMKLINVLCLCCRESVNRMKMREMGGVNLLLKAARDASMSVLHDRIVSALVCFLYDDASVALMLENAVVDILLDQMSKCMDVDTRDLVELSSAVMRQEIEKECEDFECADSMVMDDEHSDSFHEPDIKEGVPCTVVTDDTLPSRTFAEKWVQLRSTDNVSEQDMNVGGGCEQSISTVPGDGCPSVEVKDASMNDTGSGDAIQGLSTPCEGDASACPADDGAKSVESKERVKYSIDSPTYQHTDWDYTEYYKGAKCKTTFSSEPPDWDGYQSDISVQQSSMYSPAYSSPRSSYSPFSNSSFASPSRSPCYGPFYSPPLSPDYQSSDSSPTNMTAASPTQFLGSPGKVSVVQKLCFSPEHSESEEIPPSASDASVQANVSEVEIAPEVPGSGHDVPEKQESVAVKDGVPTTSQCSFGFEVTKTIETNKVDSDKLIPVNSDKGHSQSSSVKSNFDQTPLKAKAVRTKTKNKAKPAKVRRGSTISNPLSVLDVSDSDMASDTRRDDMPSPENQTISNILTFLSVLSHVDQRQAHILNSRCIDLLLTYITVCRTTARKAWRILIRLARNPNYFEKFVEMDVPLKVCTLLGQLEDKCVEYLKTQSKTGDSEQTEAESLNPKDATHGESGDFVLSPNVTVRKKKDSGSSKACESHQSPRHSERSSLTMVRVAKESEIRKQRKTLAEEFLRTLMLVAEGRYGQEVILHRFKSGTVEEKWTWVVNVAYLCRSHFLQSRLLLKGGGLEVLFTKLLAEDDRHGMMAVHSVAVLGDHLKTRALERKGKLGYTGWNVPLGHRVGDNGGKETEQSNPSKRRRVMDNCRFEDSDLEKDVTFSFDDDTHFTTNRGYLCSKSQVFTAMLRGHYSESSKSAVSISEVQRDVFIGMVHFLYGCDQSPHCQDLHHSDLTYNLDLLCLADKYLLSDLSQFAASKLKRAISPKSVGQIMEYATLLRCAPLIHECLYYIMFSHLPLIIRMKLIHSLAQGTHGADRVKEAKQLMIKLIND